ncbi:uncharacterized protein [Physcomitrium patens]|uniref:uncharacterized protein isoform X4 n=1 Tax=Physcomitrium patens TaxID=3218 RepID=UPI000D17E278|nr:E3 ubiquitin-protein ligase RNF216-like isoform X4 [Physcomitrium patens]|eukprot:XP_024395711.1 E3 ubiquitin-protein ligase RNF216-like isoform X4 [Physcomitrella patens]
MILELKQVLQMRMVGDGSVKGFSKDTVSKDRGGNSSTATAVVLVDSDSDESCVEVQGTRGTKLEAVAQDHVFRRHDQRVLDKALSELVGLFPNSCMEAAAADLSAQLKRTSPEMALKRVINSYKEHGVPGPDSVAQSERKSVGRGRIARRGERLGQPQLGVRAGEAHRSHEPHLPCACIERERESVLNVLKDGARNATGALNADVELEKGTHKDADESDVSGNIECGCCFSEYRFEEMVQCAEGHLFCFTCLRRRVEESTFGGSQACSSLACMDTSGCEEYFPWSEVKRALPSDVFAKYEQRQAEDAVVQAKLTGLVYCPFCNMPWEVDPGLRVLKCANERCQKQASCVNCREPSHIPLRCEEVERDSETSLRRTIEERMTEALIRECSACKAALLKSGGCNKVTCRCGQTMCYLCRQPISPNYSHFCQHAGARKGDCNICKKCSLWEMEEEDEIVKSAREAAMNELILNDQNLLKRTIGPTLENAHQKKHRPPPRPPAGLFRPPPPEHYNRVAQAMVHVSVAEQKT